MSKHRATCVSDDRELSNGAAMFVPVASHHALRGRDAQLAYCEAWQSHDIIRLCKTETKLLFTWFNFVISPYAWLHVTCIHWEMFTSWPGKTDNWQNVLCSYDPICAQIMAIKTWYYQNWYRYMCGFLTTSTKYNICQFNVHRLYIYNHNIMIKKTYKNQHIHNIYIYTVSEEFSMLL